MSNSDNKSCLSAIGALLLVPVIALYAGWVISILWGWFVVPLGVPSVGAVHAYGLALVVAMFTAKCPTKKDDREDLDVGVLIFTPVLLYTILLVFGWIAQYFM